MIIHRRRGSALAEAADLQPGQTFAGYRIERLLGSGGMGAVYEATQLSLKRRVALKLIAAGVPINETLLGRFRREGELQAVIDHPHILPVYEAGEAEGRLFIAMRLVPGPTLKTLAAGRSLEPPRTMHLLGDVGAALDAAHSAGLVHRDVKPQNILVAPGDHAYLADFGLSRGRSDNTLTRSGQLLGSLNYMAPEQIRGERVEAAADIYSFTCVLYECLVGLVPYPRESDAAVLHAHEWDEPPKPSEIRAELPPALDDVIAQGMAKDPDERPASACALIVSARDALGLEAGATHATVALHAEADVSEPTLLRPTRAAAPAPDTSRRRRRLPRWAIALAATLALVAGLAAGYLVAREPTKAAPPPQTVTGVADTNYAAKVSATFANLRRREQPLQHQLSRARTAAGQARALDRTASAYRDAASVIRRAHPDTKARAANAAVSAALAGVADAYASLSAAAGDRKRATYNRRSTAVAQAKQKLATAVTKLEQAGYSVK